MVIQIWQIVILAVDAPLFAFHLSMIVFLIVQIRRKNPEFSGGFYRLFIVLGVNDLLLYVDVSYWVTEDL